MKSTGTHKALWQHCKTDLEELGLTFKSRRDSDKRSVSDAVLGDILVAFDTLDNASKPRIFSLLFSIQLRKNYRKTLLALTA